MQCTQCDHDNRDGARFCEACGAALQLACSECGQELRAGARFCDQCGTAIDATKPVGRAVSGEGERRIVTVLFADAVGHTTVSEQLGEEKTYELMQGCFARMQQAVERFGGSVNQYTGDGILALFGAPLALEDSARRAVSAALAMQGLLNEYAEEVHRRHPVQCAYRIGLNTGPVVVGSISEKLDLEMAAVGDTVNLAARMQTLAEPGTVCVSEGTYRAVTAYFEFETLGGHVVKGKPNPVNVYRPLRERDVHNRLEVSLERGLTPYTGREQEQKVLAGYLTRAANGQGQVVLVSGEAGIGKSRTLFEFHRAMDPRRLHWIGGQCISFGENIPYLPVVGVLKSAFGIDDADTEADIVQKVDAAMADWREEHAGARPYIRFLLNVDPGDESVAAMDPQVRRAGFLDAFRALVAERCLENTLVVAIEDLHWIDDQSQEIVANLADFISRLPVLMLLTARQGYQPSFGERSHFNRLALTHLTPDCSAMMVERALGSSGLPEEVQTLIASKAEGNPFYIEEVIRSFVETGVLTRSNGAYTLTGDLAEVDVPDTIHEVILSRIDRLDPGAKEAMQLASVIGREFTVRLLNRISDLEDRLNDTLSELNSLELIYESGFMPELSYMFKHALTHDVAYSTLLSERRRRLHRTVAEAIEALFEGRLVEHYESLAHHYERAEVWDKALRYLRRSAFKSTAAFANAEAIDYFSRALAAAERLGEEFMSTRADLLQSRGGVHDLIGNFDAAIADYESAAQIYRELGDTRNESLMLSFQAVVQWENHDFDKADVVAERALELAGPDDKNAQFAAKVALYYNSTSIGRRARGDAFAADLMELAPDVDIPHFQALWVLESCLDLYWQGRFEDEAAFYEEWKPMADRFVVTRISAQWTHGMCTVSMGRHGEALALLEDAIAFATRVGSWFYEYRLANTIGWLYNEIQDFEKALPWNQRSIDATLNSDMPDIEIEFNARLNLGEALMALGRMDAALAEFKKVEPVVRNPKPEQRMSLHNFSMHWMHAFGEYELFSGRAEAALGLAEECIALAEENKRRRYVVKGLRLRGQAKLDLGEDGGADLESSVELARALGNPTQLWKSLAALGAWQAKAGDDSGAISSFNEAAGVVDGVVGSLTDEQRRVFLESDAVSGLLASAGRV